MTSIWASKLDALRNVKMQAQSGRHSRVSHSRVDNLALNNVTIDDAAVNLVAPDSS